MSGKSYSVEQNERLRERARDLLSERYDGNKTALAAALGLSQATVSNFLNGKSGAGFQLVTALARELGVTHDALVHGRSVAPEGSIRFGDLPGWQQAIQEVLRSDRRRMGDDIYHGASHVIVKRAKVRHTEADVWAVQCELVLPYEVAIRCSNVEHAMHLQPNASRELLEAVIARAHARFLRLGWRL